MARSRPSPRCRCGSGRKLARCCGPVLDGRPAATPAALMRSRYTAYARAKVDHIIATTAPEGPVFRPDTDAWREELHHYTQTVRFVGLELVDVPEPEDDRGWVRFRARLVQDGVETVQEERSRFVRRAGRWLYWGED